MRQTPLIVYQIYPKSFCDLNGDGVGDICGIRSKIDYLKHLGITAVWISPCFESPLVDNGYDISNYEKIAPVFGTLAEFDKMVAEFHEAGIKVILDLVANHTSTEHEWFLQSRASKDNPYRDYYIWRKTPPNDWKSVFGGSAWEYDSKTGEYYLHSFAKEQADLNWENPEVRAKMQAVVRFWVERGVDGFRCDVLDMISKDFVRGKNGEGAHLHEYIKELFAPFKGRLFTVGECWSANAKNAALYCKAERKELTTVFCFDHLCVEKGRFRLKKPSLKEVCKRLAKWQKAMQKIGVPPSVFLGNHDQPRAVSRFGEDKKQRYESATLLAALVLLHSGIPFLYQGEEWGTANGEYTDISQFKDVETLHYYLENKEKIQERELLARINAGSRDQARRMLSWDEKPRKSWCAPYTRQAEICLTRDMRSKNSIHAAYRQLIALRKREVCLYKGDYRLRELTSSRYVFDRCYKHEKIRVVCAFERGTRWKEPKGFALLYSNQEIEKGRLKPYQVAVYKKEG